MANQVANRQSQQQRRLVIFACLVGGVLFSTQFGEALLQPPFPRSSTTTTRSFGSRTNRCRHPTAKRASATLFHSRFSEDTDELEEHDMVNITVSYEGELFPVSIQRGQETILNALERQHQLSTRVDLPSDCRRGNCLTCAARILTEDSSVLQQHLRSTDGLSPTLSKFIREQGFLLTCSTYVLKKSNSESHPTQSQPVLELGAYTGLWKKVYADRLVDEDVRVATKEAMARAIRRSAEDNIEEWTRDTERLLLE
jgi:ferredoxin